MNDAPQPSDPGKTEVRLPAVSVEASESQFFAVACILLVAMGCLTVSGCLTEGFSPGDDMEYVVNNRLLQPETPWIELVKSSHYAQYIPVTMISYRLNCAFFGREAAWSFRAVNWLLHAGSGMLLMWLLIGMGLKRWEALFVAVAWVAHPMASESTAWIAERNNVLAFFFGIAALAVHVRWHGTWKSLLGGMGLLALALLSKPSALNWIPIFFAYEMLGGPYRLGNLEAKSDVDNNAGMGVRLAPLLPLGLLFTMIAIHEHRIGMMPLPGGSIFTALLTDTEIFARYIGNVLVPLKISAVYYVEDVQSLGDSRIYLYTLLLAAAVGGTLFLARNRRRAAFGWLWFFLGFATNANLVAISFLMADRYAYIPAAGLFIVLLEFVMGLAGRISPAGEAAEGAVPAPSPGARKALIGMAAVYVAFLGALAAGRSYVWSSQLTLFENAMDRQPDSALAKFYYAMSSYGPAKIFRDSVADCEKKLRTGLIAPADAAKYIETQSKMAQEWEEKIAKSISEGVKLKDAYRYHDQLAIRVLWARAANQLGRHKEALEALNGFLPPPDHSDGPRAGLDKELYDKGQRAMRFKDFELPYHYVLSRLSEAYCMAADAELQAFLDTATPVDQARASLGRVIAMADRAVEARANSVNAYEIKASAILAQEAMEKVAPAEADETQRLKFARELLAKARTSLMTPGAYYADDKTPGESPEDAERSIPLPRLKAWGFMALAEAYLNDSQMPGLDTDKGMKAALEGLGYADRALAADEKCYDAYWVQARIHLALDRFCEKKKDLVGSNEHFAKAKELLNKIPPAARRFKQAQEDLKTLRPPPKPPAAPEQKTDVPAKTGEPEKKSDEPAKKTDEPAKKTEEPAKSATAEPAKKTEEPAKSGDAEPAKKTEVPAKTP